MIREPLSREPQAEGDSETDVAVIGMAGRFPGARDLDQFWTNLAAGVESITTLGDAELSAAGVDASVRRAAGYVPVTARLDDAECFDAACFGYSPREAALLDPQGRVCLELAWHAFEDAGVSAPECPGAIGVFATTSLNTYLLHNLRGRVDPQDFILGLGNIPVVVGNASDFSATRISYKFNLRGPSVAVQTACSSSLVAIHLARQSLLNGECDVALAGGVSIYLPQDRGYRYQEGMILSPDGHCRAFDADANGIVFGRGGGMVVLKLLARAQEDGDRIRAVIKGSAVNNDGSRKVGFTAPSVAGQSRVITEALADAGVRAESISYLEAHGTGTKLGDPIEVAALTEAFRKHTARTGYCALGTVKTNIGHLDVAAGVTGFIKTVLMLEHRQLVPSLHFRAPNPEVDFASSPFYVIPALRPWDVPSGARRAGVSAFGIGGTNAHVIVEEAPGEAGAVSGSENPIHVMRVTARTEDALSVLCVRVAERLEGTAPPDLGDVCHTANTGRAHLPHRVVVRASSTSDLREGLTAAAAGSLDPRVVRGMAGTSETPSVAFLFTGLGAQAVGMGQALYRFQPVFRAALERCDVLLRPHFEQPLLSVLYPPPGQASPIDETVYGQPVMFAFEYALAALWRSWGVRPSALLGHSLGEYAAACVAGLVSLEEVIRLVAIRGRLMDSLPPGGGMAAVFAPESRVRDLLAADAPSVSIASINAPENTVISGPADAVADVAARFSRANVEVRILNVSKAFHSTLVEPVLDEYERAVAQARFGRAGIPVISNLTGQVLSDEDGRDPRYWRRHAREAVRFADGVRTLYDRGIRHFLEVGPHTTVTGMAAGCLADSDAVFLPSLRRGREDWDQILETLSELYVRGVAINWAQVDPSPGRRRVALPLYPFARVRHWIEPPTGDSERNEPATGFPMLGRAVRSPLVDRPAFELRAAADLLPFLRDHRVFDATVLPATGYIEAALEAVEAATGRRSSVVEELEIPGALTTAGATARLAQVLLTPEQGDFRFEVFATDSDGKADAPWQRLGSGLVKGGPTPGVRTRSFVPDDIRTRCTRRLSGEAYYEDVARLGFAYGPSFRGVQQVWSGDGEALGEIHLPASVAEDAASYLFHPALLDSCLQIVLGLMPPGRTFLPVRFDRVVLGPWQADLVVHAVLRSVSEGSPTVQGDVTIGDPQGTVVAEVEGVVLQEVDQRRWTPGHPPEWHRWLYETTWVPAARPPAPRESPALPGTESLGRVLRERLEPSRQRHRLDDYEAIQPELDRACSGWALEALQALGWYRSPGEALTTRDLCRTLSIAGHQERMTNRLLEMLCEDGLLKRTGPSAWLVSRAVAPEAPSPDLGDLAGRYPALGTMLDLVDRCGRSLASALRGETKGVDVLFPGGSIADLELLYRESPFAQVYNELVVSSVEQVLAALGADCGLRVLEVGAGTGSTTAGILPVLPSQGTRYVFTDVSRLFLARAQDRFDAFPFVEYRLLDADADPGGQGFSAGAFDLVVASNVLHATPDLRRTLGNMRRLLAPGGLLLMVEGIARQRWVDLTFGLTEGWWKYTDTDVRPDYPLVSQERWRSLLAETGFCDDFAIPGEDRPAALFHQAVIVARRGDGGSDDGDGRQEPASRQWLIVEGGDRRGASLATSIRERGDNAFVTSVDAIDTAQFRLNDVVPGGGRLDGVAFLPPSPAPRGGTGDAESLSSTRALLRLVQVLAEDPASSAARLWIVTRGAQGVVPGDEVPDVFAAPIWGLAEVIRLEYPDLRCSCIDIDPDGVNSDELLRDELAANAVEARVAFRGGRRYVARLARALPPTLAPRLPAGGTTWCLESSTPGLFDGLKYVERARRQPGAGEVEIQVRAAALNFKDVLTALGRVPGGPDVLGYECAGEIVGVGDGATGFAIGDAVVAFAPGSMATRVIADARLVAPMPASLSFEQAATIAGGFLTAHHALHDLARIGPSDRILIHAATGGVGLWAVQLAKRAGAEVFATAGTEAKRALLSSMGVRHVFSSRTCEFASEIGRVTEGRGVTVVLNSLTGAVLDSSVAVLAAGGRFVELGRGEALSRRTEERIAPGGSYFAPNVAATCLANPERFGSVLRDAVGAVARGEFAPLPYHVFESHDVAVAFRLMARGGHVGKVVIRAGDGASEPGQPSAAISSDSTYLIVGGLGDLGLLVAERLVGLGARHLALMSRRTVGEAERAAIDRLTDSGAQVLVLAGDVSRREDVDLALGRIRQECPPLRGVVQAAGVLDDGVLGQQTWERFSRVMAPKVDGTWYLHTALEGQALDFFVLFSSVASLLGSAGQGNHAAANAFLDALAFHRRALGLPAVSISWGPWSSVGAAARLQVGGRLAARGLGEIPPDEGLAALDQLLAWPRPHVGVVPIDWRVFGQQFAEGMEPSFTGALTEAAKAVVRTPKKAQPALSIVERLQRAAPGERRDIITRFIRDHVAKSLGLDPAQPIDEAQPLAAMGLDSLLAVELRNALSRGLGSNLHLSAALLFDYPSVGALAEHFLTVIVKDETRSAPVADSPTDATLTDDEGIARLTDEEAEALLLKELEEE